MKRSVIVAIAENHVIGKGSELPWKLSADLKRFKSITMGHPIIMGRKTYESIGRLLPGRLNIIITNNKDYAVTGAAVVHSIQEAFDYAEHNQYAEAFVIGGAAIIKEALKDCNKIYLTKVLSDTVEGDVFLNLQLGSEWNIVATEELGADEKNDYPVQFIDLERVS
ncbi:MAG: folA [Cytophagaceae bacterium]|jgi:dihydrofolate reductase|nr:folA [Cytophagaceae bacterium]